jgi:hypothetical protein
VVVERLNINFYKKNSKIEINLLNEHDLPEHSEKHVSADPLQSQHLTVPLEVFDVACDKHKYGKNIDKIINLSLTLNMISTNEKNSYKMFTFNYR